MGDPIRNICDTFIMSKGSSEIYLPLDYAPTPALRESGIDRAGVSRLKPGYKIGRTDPYHHLVLFTCDGSAVFYNRRQSVTFSPGDVLIAPAHREYGYEVKQGTWTIAWFHMVPIAKWQFLHDSEPVIRRSSRGSRIMEIARAFTAEVLWEAPPDNALARSLSDILMHMLERELVYMAGDTYAIHRQTIAHVLETVNLRPADAWNINSMAREAHMSGSHFAMITRRLMGAAPMQLVARMRMSQAAHTLEQTNLDVGTVAEQVGYQDQFAFSVAFKRYYGESPRAYRKKVRAKENTPVSQQKPH